MTDRYSKTSTAKKAITTALSKENTVVLGRVFWLMAKQFCFSEKQTRAVLGLGNRGTANNHRRGSSIPHTIDGYARVSQLLGAKKCLEILYPRNPEVIAHWFHVERECFGGKSAIGFIADDPLESQVRLHAVRRMLDMLRNGTVNELV